MTRKTDPSPPDRRPRHWAEFVPRPLKPALGRAVHLWFRLSRGMTLGVRAAVLSGDGRVFLVRHTYVPGWHLPGGGVETGETLEGALAKELREEADIVLAGRPHLHGVFFNSRMSRRDHVALFVVRDFSVIAPKRPDREIAEAGFFPLGALPEGTTAATRRRLAEIAGEAELGAEW